MEATAQPSVQDRLALQLENILTKKIENDQFVLPSLPQVATKCLGLLRGADMSLRDAAKLMESDPVLTAQLLKVVNSAAMAGREPIRSLLQAVTRMGAQKLRSFLIEASARKVFESNDARIAQACAGLWQHAVAVAILCRDLVVFTGVGDPEFAYLGGLLHDIGKPVVAGMLLETERAIQGTRAQGMWISGDDWIGVVQRCHRRVGVALCERWQMPDVVCRSVADCEEYDNSDRTCVANVVRFANALAKQAGYYVGDVSKDDNDALVMIGRSLLNISEELTTKLATGLKKSVREQMT